jgi:SAM-dependent methyltransferase
MASFEAVADVYDLGRPSYPTGVLDALGPLSGLRVLDAGAGTGIATRQLLARGAAVVALDPGAELLRRAANRSPGLTAVVGDGGAMPFAEASFDLVCFAQSWHWINPATRCHETHRVLRTGGRLAAWWSHARADGQEWFDRYWSVIEAACPGTNRHQRDADWGATMTGSGLFRVAEKVVVPWTRSVSVDAWITDLLSHSYIAALGEPEREVAIDEVRSVLLHGFPDGQLSVPYETWLWVAGR